MKKLKKKWIIIAIWILFVYLIKHFDLLSLDLTTFEEFITENRNYAFLLYIGLWIVRLLFLIPGTTLMIMGGVCFGPVEGFLLSTVGNGLSASFIYLVSRNVASHHLRKYLDNRYPELNGLLETYNYKILALGIICPIAPADVICFLSASIGIKYSTYILTIVISGIPLRLLYSFVGMSLIESTVGLVLLIVSFAIIFITSIKVWNTMKQKIEMQQ